MVLRSLMQMLRKHKVQLPKESSSNKSTPASLLCRGSLDPLTQKSGFAKQTAPLMHPQLVNPLTPTTTAEASPSDSSATFAAVGMNDPMFDEFWHMAMQNTGDDTMHWDNLFSDLDTRII